jgi:hypothetical protein
MGLLSVEIAAYPSGTRNDACVSLQGAFPTVIARSEIPRLRFGTGSAISVEGHEIATYPSGARNDGLTNQATTKMRLTRTGN